MIITLKTQDDLFRELGAAVICEIETVVLPFPEISKHHKHRKKTLIKLLIELRQTPKVMSSKYIRTLLYKYFPKEVRNDLDFVHKLAFKTNEIAEQKSQLNMLVTNWLKTGE